MILLIKLSSDFNLEENWKNARQKTKKKESKELGIDPKELGKNWELTRYPVKIGFNSWLEN